MNTPPIGLLRRAAAIIAAALPAFAMLPSLGGGGVTGTGYVANGTVTDFGSVFVNGVEFFTDGADIFVNGVRGSESQLRVGMAVRVEGVTFSPDNLTGEAKAVTYDADLRGVAQRVPAAGGGTAVAIGGLTALLDDDTVLDGILDASAIAAGDRLEVSGIRDPATGMLRATYVSRRDVAAGTILTGAVSGLAADRFTLGTTIIKRDDALLGDRQVLANGALVRVTSRSDLSGGLLKVDTIVALVPGLGAAPGSEASAEGLVRDLTATSFGIGGVGVRYDADTEFRNGSLANLQDGLRAEVEGKVDVAGVLVARKIVFREPQGASVDATVLQKTLDGFVMLVDAGIEVVVSPGTQVIDRSSARLDVLTLADLAAGDRVLVRGVEPRDGVLLAHEVVRLDPSPMVTLSARARAASAATNAVSLLSVRVAGLATYRDADGTLLAASDFFAKAAGRHVVATGVPVGGGVAATSLQIVR